MNQNEPMDKAAKEPEEVRKAKEKAMRLLLQQDRTEKELRDRLYRAGFSETASEAAMQYVSGFGYFIQLCILHIGQSLSFYLFLNQVLNGSGFVFCLVSFHHHGKYFGWNSFVF